MHLQAEVLLENLADHSVVERYSEQIKKDFLDIRKFVHKDFADMLKKLKVELQKMGFEQ